MAKPNGKSVYGIAAELQHEAKEKENVRAGVDYLGKSTLKADASKGQYTNSAVAKNLQDTFCNIDEKYSNVDTNLSQGPCHGKGNDENRFHIGVEWKQEDTQINPKHQGVLLPPRRRHMCTSNLENLNTNAGSPLLGGTNNNAKLANDSFLGDVLLTAYKEAEWIKNNYSDPNDHPAVCRAVRNSFADIGDIIRGRDVWTQESGMQQLQQDLVKIFEKIKDIIPGNLNKYKNSKTPYLELRSDWWSANRDQIWKAMKCHVATYNAFSVLDRPSRGGVYKVEPNCGYGVNVTPFDDYIPQRLRWMSEWVENYCRKQHADYKSVKSVCDKCKGGVNGQCTKGGNECTLCSGMCKTYVQNVKQWKEQWKKQEEKYTEYISKTNHSGSGTGTNDENVVFLKRLKEGNNGNNNAYSTVAEFVESMRVKGQCQYSKQHNFEDASSGSEDYAFNETPKDYKAACNCDQVTQVAPPQTPSAPTSKCTGNKVIDTATDIQQKAYEEAKSRAFDKLKGNIENAQFKDGKTMSSGNICELKKEEHTNDKRTYDASADGKDGGKHSGPCTGKGGNEKVRFNIGKKWEPHKDVNTNHTGVLFPPRRLDMCTSNLEYLGTKGNLGHLKSVDDDKFNDSFFADVLLAAKYEGEFISHKLYDDTSRICNAMKYSFADFGDIIRGRDIWSRNDDMIKLETNLKAIFKKIHEQNGGDNGKYASDNENSNPPYKKLREDWWEANRKEIWEAMTCTAPDEAHLYIPTTDGTYRWQDPKCGRDSNYIPPDDYIPQKLRWMTEWTESYCKQLERNYRPLIFSCGACKKYVAKNKQENMSEEKKKICKMCVGLCGVYKKHVETWKPQWEKLKDQYQKLYNDGGAAGSDPIKEQDDFMKKLKDPNGSTLCTNNTDYSNIANYVTSMGGNRYCIDAGQKELQDGKNTGTEGTFREQPYKYDTECKWDVKPQNPSGAEPEPNVKTTEQKGEDPCAIVKEILDNNDGNTKVGECNLKYDQKNNPQNTYPGWDCEQKQHLIENGNTGACMPPRRQKLCVHFLTQTIGDETQLRRAFIQTAAAETFLHWQYFIEHGGGNQNAEKLLNSGTIPAIFKRQMVYTFGDFKDLCLNSDISVKDPKSNVYVTTARTNIDNVFKNGSTINEAERKKWWEQNGLDIWQGMVCALSHTVKEKNTQNEVQRKLITNYKYDPDKLNSEMGLNVLYTDSTPQFLRWFIEWGDEFCTKYLKELYDLYKACMKCKVNGGSSAGEKCNVCEECRKQCEAYRKFIGEWKNDYEKQKGKFDRDKAQYEDVPFVESSRNAHENLDNALEMLDVKSSCMEEKSKTTTKDDMPQSLDEYPPGEFKSQCECDDKQATSGSSSNTCDGKTVEIKEFNDGNKPLTVCIPKDKSPLDGTVYKQGIFFQSNKGRLRNGKKTNNIPLLQIYNIDSYLGKGSGNPCGVRSIDAKEWKCDKYRNNNQYNPKEDNVCLPPRTQILCVGNLNKETTNTHKGKQQSNIDDIDSTEKLLTEVLVAAKYEGENLSKNFKKNNLDEKILCSKVKYSFGDLADIIKGKKIYDPPSNDKTESNLGTIFQKIYTNLNIEEQSKYNGSNGEPNYTKLREEWWNANRQYVWTVLVDRAAPTDPPGCLKKYENNPPDIDGTPQFLRWFTEWSEEFYKEYEQKIKEIKSECEKNGQNNICTNGKPPGNCGIKCKEYKNWIEKKKKDEWEKLEKKYNDDQNSNKYTDYDNMADMLSPTAYLNFSCMEDKCPSINYPKVMKIEDKTYKSYCNCDSDEYKNRVQGKDDSTSKTTTDPCSISETNFGCNKKIFGKYWSPYHVEDENGKKIYGVYRPPRRQKLCIANIIQYSTKDNLLENVLVDAQNEANLILEYYKKEYTNIKSNTDNDFPSSTYYQKACRAIKRSFYDFGDIIKGTDMENAAYSNYARLRLKDTFTEMVKKEKDKQQLSSYVPLEEEIKKKREEWWVSKKGNVWKAMTQCRGITKCGTIPDNDKKPQFLRWLEEWYEDFCEKRQKLANEVKEKCDTNNNNYLCKVCHDKCKEYKDYMTNKEKQWKGQGNHYKQQQKNSSNKKYYKKEKAKEYLKEEYKSNNSGGDECKEVETNIELLDKQPGDDVEEHCSCKKYNDDKLNKDILGQSNCEGLAKEATTSSGIKWIHDDGTPENKYLGQRGLSQQEYVPPRRQKLCIEGLDTLDVNSDENKLRHHLIKLFAGEGYNLGQYYKNKETNNDDEKYSYHVSPCSAMKYSFLDLRDIILGHDMVEPDSEGTESKLKTIFDKIASKEKANQKKETHELRKTFWDKNIECFWEAIKCGYKRGNGKDLENCDTIPSEIEYPVGKDRNEGKEYQFLRWFTEWGEDFCKHKEKKYTKLKAECDNYKCGQSGQNKTNCEKACQDYRTFVEKWKDAYNKQSQKYFKDKDKDPYNTVPEVNDSQQAYKYLYKSLKKNCANGECNCMEQESETTSSKRSHGGNGTVVSENYDTHKPASLDETPSAYKEKCGCDNNMAPTADSLNPGSSEPDGGKGKTKNKSQVKKVTKKVKKPKKDNPAKGAKTPSAGSPKVTTVTEPIAGGGTLTVSTISSDPDVDDDDEEEEDPPSSLPNSTPEPPDATVVPGSTPSAAVNPQISGGGIGGGTQPSSSSTSKDNVQPTQGSQKVPDTNPKKEDTNKCKTKNPKSTETIPKNCVENIAKNLQESYENKVDCTLMGKGLTLDCTKEITDSSSRDNSCDHHKRSSTNRCNRQKKNPCGTKGENRFNVNTEWKCYKNLNPYRIKKGVCIPPRREHICISNLDEQYVKRVNDGNYLLKMIMLAARNEGIDIIKNIKSKNYGNRNPICDAMKYSFADLADIVRGRDILLIDGDVPPVEIKLYEVFKNIYEKWKEQNKGTNIYHNIQSFRSAWWDANRESIWKALTCSAPTEEKIYKTGKIEGFERLTVMQDKCGHNDDPPVDDYIPQPLRWMTEWSEYFCKAMNKKLDEMKVQCEKCRSGNSCKDDTDGNICKICKNKCDEYKIFINKWKEQFDIQSIKYNELYKKAESDRTLGEDINNFVQKLKKKENKCSVEKASEYIHETSRCVNYNFNKNDDSSKPIYAFETTPNGYDKACKCEIPDPLDKCPSNNTKNEICKRFEGVHHCSTNTYENKLSEWNNILIKDNTGENKGVLLPPRRRYLCIDPLRGRTYKNNDLINFKKDLLDAAYSQGRLLGKKYPNDNNEALQAMKYSFADYGDIIKGMDMVDYQPLDKLRTRLDDLLKENNASSNNSSDVRKTWWEQNRTHVWHAMLCGYKSAGGTVTMSDCILPDDDKTSQFLRWLEEWAKQACKEKLIKSRIINTKCKDIVDGKKYETKVDISDIQCKRLFTEYENWFRYRNNEWMELSKKYDKIKNDNNYASNTPTEENAEKYIKNKCVDCKCDLNDLNEINKHSNNDKELFKELISIANYDGIGPNSFIKQIGKISNINSTTVRKTKDFITDMFQKGLNYSILGAQIGITTGIVGAGKLYDTINDVINKVSTIDSTQPPAEPPSPRPPQNNEPDITNNILSSTLPVGISFALGSIALLFYLKKKPKTSPVDIFRVLDIPQNDYNIPDETSTNRYVPYSKYKGKTYIYVEGEETNDYIRDKSSSDITSSSESEYEEMDINDIYGYKSPKYKTLIEVVLKPSKTYDAQNIHIDNNMEDSSDTPPNKLTDNEWNQLKHDFISQYLQNIQMELPNENIINDDIYKNIEPNILPKYMEEKPFITSIQDRVLHGDSEVTYNIDWNVPENINSTTNIINNPKYVSNDQYTGIDLINDALNSDQHIDIYDELLKRKENEMFGTKHPKTSIRTNSVATKKHNDSLKSPNRFM
ncbi:erythrocyte membrane protein 1, PfEMP1, putative [Plasmodium sp. gorilla clade G2]|uniref:erythrocyte membrane protein 1, PfEMP1, putative n=1 Tax=Plasmodium sp. gorilla clade G2 TaxID=880535 RepID=UPI000D2005E8|nr:erythrocyte membrane protein 1, PfEMP1, putative [Plasmodium sp. gorilla clade G2]SOV10663.1 erythrocyte membrane protein 1, PfEMP1, putative [Plasmodium sp. gorilla clade G2]